MKGLTLFHHRGGRGASFSLSHTAEAIACAKLLFQADLGDMAPPSGWGWTKFKRDQSADDEEYKLAALSLRLNSHFKAFIDLLLY